jgi:hypothetical protein
MESTEKVFAKGLFVKPTDKDWLPVKITIKATDFVDFMNSQGELINANNGWLSIDVKKNAKGMYAEVNTWTPSEQVTSKQHSPDRETVDLPF